MKRKLETNPVSLKITSDFWKTWRNKIATKVIPYQWEVISDQRKIVTPIDPGSATGQDIDPNYSHAVRNLKIAAGLIKGDFWGFVFQDSDVYKWLEEAAYCLTYKNDVKLKRLCDKLIDIIAKAQQKDGYLVTPYQIKSGKFKNRKRFTQINQSHEMYTMGHYIEAGIAYYLATGNKKALTVAKKMADCLNKHFGTKRGQIPGSDGHPEIELALAKLYEVTKDEKYLKLGKFFIEIRGKDPYFYDKQNKKIGDGSTDIFPHMRKWSHQYTQSDKPFVKQQEPYGHGVRAAYLLTGAAHIGRLTNDKQLINATKRLWNNIVHKRMYITGAIGQQQEGESFTYDYDLPNDTLYGESCASVAMGILAGKMLELELKGEYGDILEKEIFNSALSGIALDGRHFYYVNPLEAFPEGNRNCTRKHVLLQRAEWFTCACCPSNIARFIASIHKRLYTLSKDNRTICAHQFVANKATFFDNIKIEQKSNFPWDGHIEFDVNIPKKVKPINFVVRIPSWSAKKYSIKLNGKVAKGIKKDGMLYLKLASGKHKVVMELDMSVKLFRANNAVKEDTNKVCVLKGPVVYCAEGIDNSGLLWNYTIKPSDIKKAKANFKSNLLEGVCVIQMPTYFRSLEKNNAPLYQELIDNKSIKYVKKTLKLIPYYAWANRGLNAMMVWFDVYNGK